MDPCLDDCVMFAKRLKAIDNDVSLDILSGLPHGFLNFVSVRTCAHTYSKMRLLLPNTLHPYSCPKMRWKDWNSAWSGWMSYCWNKLHTLPDQLCPNPSVLVSKELTRDYRVSLTLYMWCAAAAVSRNQLHSLCWKNGNKRSSHFEFTRFHYEKIIDLTYLSGILLLLLLSHYSLVHIRNRSMSFGSGT